MAQPHNPYPTASEMGALAKMAKLWDAPLVKSTTYDHSAVASQSGCIVANSSTAFATTIGKPKQGDVLIYVIGIAAGAGSHTLVPGTGVTIKEKDGTTSVTTNIAFGTTAVAGTWVRLEYLTTDTWVAKAYGVGAVSLGTTALPTGVTES